MKGSIYFSPDSTDRTDNLYLFSRFCRGFVAVGPLRAEVTGTDEGGRQGCVRACEVASRAQATLTPAERAALNDAPFRVRLETGVPLFVDGVMTDPGDARTAPTVTLTDTLAALRQRAASALASPPTAETPSRPAGGRQRATSRRGGGR